MREPTHHRVLQQPNVLDLIFTKEDDFVSELVVLPPLGKSHHSVLTFELNFKRKKGFIPTSTKFIVSKGDYEGMREHVGAVDWNGILNDEATIDECWKGVSGVILGACDKFVPRARVSKGGMRRRDQIPTSLLDIIRKKRKAFKTYKKFPTQENYNMYARARNQVRRASRKNAKEREHKLAREAKRNPKAFFRYVNDKTKPKETISKLKKDDGSFTENDQEKANVLNNFFGSVFTKVETDDMPEVKSKCNTEIDSVTITEKQMMKELESLGVNKSPGPDEIHPRVLKELATQLSRPLTYLFNRTIMAGKIPSAWKTAEVKPIFKKGDKFSPGNYRPVSLTSVVCKIFEKFIRDQLCAHFNDNNLLAKDQFGFTKGRSCITQLLVTMSDWVGSLEDGESIDAVYLDLQKAFDTVSHDHLLHKLKVYGVGGRLWKWIEDFLKGRSQKVNINGIKSEVILVTSGVPQGSVLGPILFLYFINDLPECVDCNVKIFADDTKAYSSVNENIESKFKVQNCIDNLVTWADTWLMKFNGKKCKIMHLGKHNPMHKYYMREGADVRALEATVVEKDLGVFVDPGLTFEAHINNTVLKANRLSGLLIHTITNKSKEIMVPLFKSLVRPVLEYGNPVWSPHLRKNIDLVEGVQRRFTKTIQGTNNMNYQERLAFLHLPSLEYRRLRGDLIEVYKMIHGFYDQTTTKKLLTLCEDERTRGHAYKLFKNTTNTKVAQTFFTNRVTNEWNNLPSEAVNASSLNAFKNSLDRVYHNILYSVNFNKLDK